jgi:hypothetical protein
VTAPRSITHIAVECRLTVAEAEAVIPLLDRLMRMVERGVVPCGDEVRENGLAALQKLRQRIDERAEPFE